MELFWKSIILALVTAILCAQLNHQEKDFSLLATLAATTLLCTAAAVFLQPVLTLLHTLADVGDLQDDMLAILLKTLAIGFIGEIAELVCNDAGNASLAKALQILVCAAVFYLSTPMFTALLALMQQILR